MTTVTLIPVHTTIASPVGELLLTSDGERLTGLHMQSGRRPGLARADSRRADEPFAEVREQLGQYFAGEREVFDLPLAPDGAPFQQRVWHALTRIPYGRTATYGELAARVRRPTAARAVGMANGRNPISIVVPCHRVIGANGRITGYAGGVDRKRFLLELERAAQAGAGFSAGNGPTSAGAFSLRDLRKNGSDRAEIPAEIT
jgi:methylated-DNA-[protein]-cysteine S-methyltransferase